MKFYNLDETLNLMKFHDLDEILDLVEISLLKRILSVLTQVLDSTKLATESSSA